MEGGLELDFQEDPQLVALELGLLFCADMMSKGRELFGPSVKRSLLMLVITIRN